MADSRPTMRFRTCDLNDLAILPILQRSFTMATSRTCDGVKRRDFLKVGALGPARAEPCRLISGWPRPAR